MKSMWVLIFFFVLALAANKIDINVEGLQVNLGSTQIPAYEFYLDSKPTEVYGFRLWQLYEAVDGKKVGPVENPRDWTFSDPQTTEDGVKFSMVHMGTGAVTYKQMEFRNTISFKNSTTSACPGSVCVKFDVVIQNYVWQSKDPTATLVMIYWLYGGNSNQSESGPPRNNKVSYGDAWFTISGTAQATVPRGDPQNVTASMLVDKSGTWVIYSHFEGTLVHDPMIGIGNPNEVNVGLIVGLSIVGIIILFVIVCGIAYFARHRPGYQSVL